MKEENFIAAGKNQTKSWKKTNGSFLDSSLRETSFKLRDSLFVDVKYENIQTV